MAATGIGNPAGYVPIGDSENPQIISGRARAETISGGVFCFASGATGVVSSGTNSFATSDLLFAQDASGAQFNGICMQTAGSNESIAIVRQADVIVVANGTIVAGAPVACDGNNAVLPLGSVAGNLAAQRNIGTAMTAGASGGFCIVHLNR